MSSKLHIKLRLSSLSHWSQRFKIGWKSRKTLLICGFLLELPFRFWIAPHSLAYEAVPWSSMFHFDNTISSLEQIFYPRNVESRKMVRWYRRLGNPDVSQPRHTTLPLDEYRSYSTQDMRRSSIASITVRWTPIRLLHFLPLTKPQLVYESHYGLPLLLRLQLGLLLDVSLQVLSPQNPGITGSQLLSVVHPE
jgi:hypothetical protein